MEYDDNVLLLSFQFANRTAQFNPRSGGGERQVLGIVGTWPEDSGIHKFDPPSILPPC